MSDWGANLTSSMMLNPFMFTSPNQMTNAYSPYPTGPLPYPPTYSTMAGGPVDAATGQPLQSYQNMMAAANAQYQQQLAAYNAAQAAPGGTSLNSTPAGATGYQPLTQQQGRAAYGPYTPGWQNGLSPQQMFNSRMLDAQAQQAMAGLGQNDPTGRGGNNALVSPQLASAMSSIPGLRYQNAMLGAQGQGQNGTPPTPPNNWRAALAALASPPTPAMPGAPIPAGGGFGQPGGGVNQAFLGQFGPGATGTPAITPMGFQPSAPGGTGGVTAIGNPNFLGALGAIQRRPQSGY